MDDRELWGVPRTDKRTLDDYWDKLLEKADHNEREEIKFFLHCTTLKGKKAITKSGCLIGGKTDLPARAPLASYEGLKGTWLAMSTRDLPSRSPYGTQRMIFRVRDIMQYMGMAEDTTARDSDDTWEAPEDELGGRSGRQKTKSGKDKKKKHKPVNSKQKDCYLRHKVTQKPRLTMPLLFFECAHFYGDNQYLRMLLVRESDPKSDWCREMCKEINIHDNPFFQFLNGRLYTYCQSESTKVNQIFIEILVVGDIVFDKLLEPPNWDEVGTLSRAGFDPRLGIC